MPLQPAPLAKSFYWPFRHWVGNQPALLPLYRACFLGRSVERQKKSDFVNTRRDVVGDTKIVIDGFPGSGNSEATKKLLESAREFEGGIANHLHSSSLVLDAVRRGLPAGVFIRSPKDCVISTLYRFKINDLVSPPNYLLKLWIKYHENCLQVSEGIVFCDFSVTISDFPLFIKTLNSKFDVGLPTDIPAELTDEKYKQRRPLTTKRQTKTEAIQFFEEKASPELLLRANHLYAELLQSAPNVLKK